MTPSRAFFLSELRGLPVLGPAGPLGRVADLAVRELLDSPEVVGLAVSGSWGPGPRFAPLAGAVISRQEVRLGPDVSLPLSEDLPAGAMLLGERIIDGAIVDTQGLELKVVTDARLEQRQGQFLITGLVCAGTGWLGGVARVLARLWPRRWAWLVPWPKARALPPDLCLPSVGVKLRGLARETGRLNPADLACILDGLDHTRRMALFHRLGIRTAAAALDELRPKARREILRGLGAKRIAAVMEQAAPAKAARVLSVLSAAQADEVLALLPRDMAKRIETLLTPQEATVWDMMTQSVIAFPPQTRVHELMALFPGQARDKEVYWYVYVTGRDGELLGLVDYHAILSAPPETALEDIMTRGVRTLSPTDTMAKARRLFDRYWFRAVPVVDQAGVLLGAVTWRDAMKPKAVPGADMA
jgi:hypothetical protein